MLIFRAYNLQCRLLDSHLFPPHLIECSAIALSKSSVRKGIWYFQFPYKKRKRTWRVLGLFGIWSSSPSNHPRPHHAPIVIVIQSEHLKHSTSPRNQSAEHPDSGCFGISGVVIGSALSKGWRSGPEAFRAGHFLRLDRNRKPRMKSLWHLGYVKKSQTNNRDERFSNVRIFNNISAYSL